MPQPFVGDWDYYTALHTPHRHLVDEILLRAPQLRAVSEGFFIVTTTVSGFTADVLRAEMIVEGMGYKVMNVEMIHNSCMEADK
ncbi:hypothetical protein LD960_11785 [Salmonella enterica]|nr:hypothetical protein [Salmonella enterica]